MTVKIIKGSLLDATEQYIVHQCNAVTNQAGGLAYYIFKKFPYADIYSERPFPYKANAANMPGNIHIRGNGDDQRFVINAIAQYHPGEPHYSASMLDGFKVREGYFQACLTKISHIRDLESIAFPFGIGCGMAGGTWSSYRKMIERFADQVDKLYNTKVVIYNNEDEP